MESDIIMLWNMCNNWFSIKNKFILSGPDPELLGGGGFKLPRRVTGDA